MKSQIVNTEFGQYTQITTPFLDRHNDHMQIYIKEQKGGYFLTDAGYIINDLEMCGCDVMSSPKRKEVLKIMLNGAGVRLNGEQLTINANNVNFAQKKHALLQTMMSVNDMFMLSRSQVTSVFLEDVKEFFELNDVRYIQSVQFSGFSGLPHTFEFAIPKSRKKPERLVRTINNVSREKIDSVLFSWEDIKENRDKNSQLYVFLNDNEKSIKSELTNALAYYGATPVVWSKRDLFAEDLVA